MNMTRKFASLLLAMILVLCAVTPAMADQGVNNDSGKVTIENAVVGQTYTIYQLLVLESYNTESKAYSYKATEKWKDFIASAAIQKVYLNTDEDGYVTWVDKADPAEFAKLAQKYAKDHNIGNQGSKEATTTTVEFTGLNLGYYLVDSTLGILCSLDTTEPSVTIKEKNEVPSVDKQVQEDSNKEWGKENTAQIGDTVNFKTTVSAKPGAQGYVLHDKMSEGLTLNQDSIAIEGLTKGTDYTVSFENDDQCTFEITFAQTYLDTITTSKDLVVNYSAILNEKAVVSPAVNPNATYLEYGEALEGKDKFKTPESETKTLTYEFDIVKTDSQNKVLNGAEFELYDAKTGGEKIALVKEKDGVYRVATTAEKSEEGFQSAKIEVGQALVKGLDADTTYWLEETKAPEGYNKLPERVEVKVEKANLKAEVSGGMWIKDGVHIVNQTGTELPSTGGMGTTLFYVVGGVLVVAAFVLLVTKRRVGAEK